MYIVYTYKKRVIDISCSLKLSEHTLWYKRPAENFNEALPLGNGRLGACVYGGIEDETVSLNEDTFWSGYPKKLNNEDYPAVYKKAKELFDSGRISEAQKTLENGFGDRLVQMYLPLANLKIHSYHSGRLSRYRRELRLDKGVHTVSYANSGKVFTRETFVDLNRQVMAMCISCDSPASVNLDITVESRIKAAVSNIGSTLCIEGNAPDCVCDYGDMYRSEEYQIYSDEADKKGMAFSVVTSVRTTGGTVRIADGMLTVRDADKAVIYLAARTGFEGFDKHPSVNIEECRQKCVADITAAKKIPYFDLINQNILAHKSFYNRCCISLGNCKNGSAATNERLERLKNGEEDNSLYALLFNYGKYLTICASQSGTQPMNLQGIWNDKILPPWNCNYTLNINTEMNYWPTLACGLFECFNPLTQLVCDLEKSGKETTRNYYGLDGWVCHHSTDLWRITHPATSRLNGNAQWGFWNMSSGWLARMLWDYYVYTGDGAYLEKVYPIMEGAARFYKGLLTECDGKLILGLTTSPENNYIENGETHAIDKSTGMTEEIIYALFTAVSKAQNILGEKDTYSELIPKLKRPEIQSDGSLCEWYSEHGVWDEHHRHVSHLYGLFPDSQFTDEQKKAAEKTLISRSDGGTGWSLAWKINLWARLGDGEHALKLLNNQLNPVDSACNSTDIGGGSYLNLFCAHPPFQIDGNFGAASGIIQMLLQLDENGEPIFLPALPEKWKSGKVCGLRIPNNRSVNFEWEDGKITKSEIIDNNTENEE